MEGIAVDLTDRVELERFVVQEEKLKTLGAITAEVAHEIRNPLFSIAGFAHRLKNRLPDCNELDIILAESRRLEDILDRIGNYLHPVAPHPRLCSLPPIITTVLDFLSPELAAKDIHVPGPNGPGGGQTVHNRHLNIHEHHIDFVSGQILQRGPAILGRDHRMPPAGQHVRGEHPVDPVVLDQQDAERRQHAANRLGHRRPSDR